MQVELPTMCSQRIELDVLFAVSAMKYRAYLRKHPGKRMACVLQHAEPCTELMSIPPLGTSEYLGECEARD